MFPNDLPATPILKLAKHIANRSSRSEDPKRYNDDEEADKEHDEDDAFEEREVLGGKRVERDRECSDSHGHEGSLPGLDQLVIALEESLRGLNGVPDSPDGRYVGWVIHRGQDENDVARLVGRRCDESLPSQSCEPPTDITQDLLHARGSIFAHPLILSTGGG